MRPVVLWTLSLVVSVTAAVAEEFTVEVTVLDGDRRPVSGATVKPSMIRSGGQVTYLAYNGGNQAVQAVSDKNGLASLVMELPPGFTEFSVWVSGDAITNSAVSHVILNKWERQETRLVGEVLLWPDAAPEGCQWFGIETLDGPVDNATICVLGRRFRTKHIFRAEDAVAIPEPFGSGGREVEPVFCIVAGERGTKQFSEDIPWGVESQEVLGPAVLQRGTTVRGVIDESLPRPVVGRVTAGAFRVRGETRSSDFSRTAAIQPDGSFEILDVPRGAHLWLQAFAGTGEEDPLIVEAATHVSPVMTADAVQKLNKRLGLKAKPAALGAIAPPLTFHADELKNEIKVPLVEAAVGEIVLTDNASEPISNAVLFASATQGGIASQYSSRTTNFPTLPGETRLLPNVVTTDGDGVATARGLPFGNLYFYIARMPSAAHSPGGRPVFGMGDVKLKSGKTSRINHQLP